MQLVPVESTTLAAVGYDEVQQLLLLEFRSHAIYLYFGVPAAAHQALRAAPSKGTYFNRFIRNWYPYSQQGRANASPEPLSAGRAE